MRNFKYFLILFAFALSSCGNTEPAHTSSSAVSSDTSELSTLVESIAPESSEEESAGPNWRVDYYVDEFGDYDLSSPYIRPNNIDGEFSNSATQDSPLSVSVMVTADDFAFMLYEYGYNVVENIYSEKQYYNLTFKYESGEKKYCSGYILAHFGDRIFITKDKAREELIEHLVNGESVKIYAQNLDRLIETYLFTLDGKGFKEAWEEYESLQESQNKKK